MAKYKKVFKNRFFCGGSNASLNFITYEDKIIFLIIPKRYILQWYHVYLLHKGTNRIKEMIHQNLYWAIIRKTARKEVSNCDT